MPYCANCGAQYKEEANFCPECGDPVEKEEAKKEIKPVKRGVVFEVKLGVFIMVVGFFIGWIGFQIGNQGLGFGGVRVLVIGLIIFIIAKWRNKKAFFVSGGIFVGMILLSLISSAWQNRNVEIKEITGIQCEICAKILTADTSIITKPFRQVKGKTIIYKFKENLCQACKDSILNGVRLYAKNNVNIRVGRSTNSKIIGELRQYEEVTTAFKKNNWYAVYGAWDNSKNDSSLGYVYAPLLLNLEGLKALKERRSVQEQWLTQYKIAEVENISYANVIRYQIRIIVEPLVSEDKLKTISKHIISKWKNQKPHNAIAFFFYNLGTNTDGHYTAGKADWAPNGKWEDADMVRTGDYSHHKLIIEVGNALGEVYEPEKEISDVIPESKRKKIFYDLVAAQDRGVGDERAYEIIADQYNIDVSIVRKIAVEGITKGWPMP